MHIHYNDQYGHTLAQKSLSKAVVKFLILVDPSLVIFTAYLVRLIYA